MRFDDPTLYGRDDEMDEYGDSGSFGESLEEDFDEEEEEEEEPALVGEEEEIPEPEPGPAEAPVVPSGGGGGETSLQIHETILGQLTYPIGAFIALAALGALLGGLGYIIRSRKK